MIVFVYDNFGNQLDILHNFVEFYHEQELGSFDFIDFTVIGVHVHKYDYLLWKDDNDLWHENIVSSEKSIHKQGEVYQSVHATNSITEVSRNFYYGNVFYTHGAQITALNNLLSKTRWSLGKYEQVDSRALWLRYETVYDGLCDLHIVCDDEQYYTTEIVVGSKGVEKRILNFVNSMGVDNNLIYYYGYDTEDVEREISVDDVITRLYCFGKEIGEESSNPEKDIYSRYKERASMKSYSGYDYVENNEAKNKYGIVGSDGTIKHSEGLYLRNDLETPANIYRAGLRKLAEVSKPRASYKAKITTFFKERNIIYNISLGDIVRVKDDDLGEVITNRVVRIRKDYINMHNTDVTIGNVSRTAK